MQKRSSVNPLNVLPLPVLLFLGRAYYFYTLFLCESIFFFKWFLVLKIYVK